jgi:hypothetical protein
MTPTNRTPTNRYLQAMRHSMMVAMFCSSTLVIECDRLCSSVPIRWSIRLACERSGFL